MSLPDQVAILRRSVERERNRRKMLQELVLEIADYLEVVMTFLDGVRKPGEGPAYVEFRKMPLHRPEIVTPEGEL